MLCDARARLANTPSQGAFVNFEDEEEEWEGFDDDAAEVDIEDSPLNDTGEDLLCVVDGEDTVSPQADTGYDQVAESFMRLLMGNEMSHANDWKNNPLQCEECIRDETVTEQ
ncbi:hypothetical protein B0T16DRAFT_462729 [Cercophora newfieldiana]|uniref:Uncharacterized protein n=1 Tax=Cercophora newfieldiana TaxID=92897 RepID=A0AA39XRR6_9PEZI|nr:hypothetical protein B0T16DRAFT_462729 [Cercophora newfieldiana]